MSVLQLYKNKVIVPTNFGVTGNGGIGTTTPYSRLTVWGNGSNNLFEAVDNASSTKFLITKAGNVGIGTTTPYGKLAITGPDTTTGLALHVANSNNTTRFVVLDNGNVGITNIAPSAQFHINRTSNAFPATSGSTQSAGQVIRIGADSAAVLDIGGNSTSGSWLQSALGSNLATNYPLLLNPNGGNVGIGTTTPYSRLTVWGTGTGSTTAFAVVNNASTTAFAVYDNGNATYAGSIWQSSDQRLKKDVQSLDASSTLDAIERLNPVSYQRIDQPSASSHRSSKRSKRSRRSSQISPTKSQGSPKSS